MSGVKVASDLLSVGTLKKNKSACTFACSWLHVHVCLRRRDRGKPANSPRTAALSAESGCFSPSSQFHTKAIKYKSVQVSMAIKAVWIVPTWRLGSSWADVGGA